jgi:hypothetical protein
MRVNYLIGMLGETLQRMRLPEARYWIAMPDVVQFRSLLQSRKRRAVTTAAAD